MSVVHVVILPISDVECLPPPQRAKRQSELARVALRRCAELAGAPLEGWTKNANDVPQPQHGWHWSIAHKPTMAVAAIARVPVGVDVERIVARRNEGLFDHVADEDEWRIMGGRSWHSFYRLWTAKEAVLKANGVGIGSLGKCRIVAIHSEGLQTDLAGRSITAELRCAGEHVVAVASSQVKPVWHLGWESPSDSGAPEQERVREFDSGATGSSCEGASSGDSAELRQWTRLFPENCTDQVEFKRLAPRINARKALSSVKLWREDLLLAPVLCAGMASIALASRQFGLSRLVGMSLSVIFLISLAVIAYPWKRRRVRRRLREYLFDHGVALCVQCGYDLRGQVEPRCPECGWRATPVSTSSANDP